VSVEYLDLADYIAIATAVTGLDLQTVMNMTNHDLADSALHAPAAGVGDTDFYPEFIDKAAVLVGWRKTIRCPTATSALHGCRCDCSSTSTTGPGCPLQPSTKQKQPFLLSPRANGTKLPPPAGYRSTFGHRPIDRAELPIHVASNRRWTALPSE